MISWLGLVRHLLFSLSLLPALLLLIGVVGWGDLQDLLYDEIVILEIFLLLVLEGGQFPVDTVEHLWIDANFGHS